MTAWRGCTTLTGMGKLAAASRCASHVISRNTPLGRNVHYYGEVVSAHFSPGVKFTARAQALAADLLWGGSHFACHSPAGTGAHASLFGCLLLSLRLSGYFHCLVWLGSRRRFL